MPRAAKRCGRCDQVMPCPTHLPANRRRPPRQVRGYDVAHERERQRWAPLVATGRIQCARCYRLIAPGAVWHLDHNADRTGYLGPSHARCNTSAQ